MEKKNKRIRYPKKEEKKKEIKQEENQEQKTHFVLEVQDGNVPNLSNIGQ